MIQYLGSGTFCHTVQCEDLRATGRRAPPSQHAPAGGRGGSQPGPAQPAQQQLRRPKDAARRGAAARRAQAPVRLRQDFEEHQGYLRPELVGGARTLSPPAGGPRPPRPTHRPPSPRPPLLWQVKLLKLLASQMTPQEAERRAARAPAPPPLLAPPPPPLCPPLTPIWRTPMRGLGAAGCRCC